MMVKSTKYKIKNNLKKERLVSNEQILLVMQILITLVSKYSQFIIIIAIT